MSLYLQKIIKTYQNKNGHTFYNLLVIKGASPSFASNSNLLQPSVPFQYPLVKVFLFLGDIEKQHWVVIGSTKLSELIQTWE